MALRRKKTTEAKPASVKVRRGKPQPPEPPAPEPAPELAAELPAADDAALRDQYKGGHTWPPTHDEEW